MIRASLPLIVILPLLASACSSGDASPSPTPTPISRSEVVAAEAVVVIQPTFARLAEAFSQLEAKTQALASAPSAGALDEARGAWGLARERLSEGDGYPFGPYEGLRVVSAVDWWPVDEAKVLAFAGGEGEVSVDDVAALGADTRGLMAMELLLFDADGGGSASLDALAAEPRRASALVAYAAYAGERAAALRDAWGPEGEGGYTDALATAGAGSEVYEMTQDGLSDVVNGLVHAVEGLADVELGKPLGLSSGGIPLPDAVQCGRSDHALADLEASLAGVEETLVGAEAAGRPSLRQLIAGLDDDLAATMMSDLAAAGAAVDAISLPLDRAVVETPDDVYTAYYAMKALHRTLASDVAAALGVTLTFSDNDGD